ncbi:MAG: hypothetical protein KGJ80_21935, partial [Chloroflexota bacterium]|nr:hypothetical protein [Chloroflexota bacterium]
PRVRVAFPNLFTPEEESRILNWFASVNRRAQTVEWTDWAYALAFSKLPEGPYENQENGAGLLALLELGNLGQPELKTVNRDYLMRNPRGWNARFRNTDDALIYQPEWINNALFQSLYDHQTPTALRRLAFKWLELQALPDGAELGYNYPSTTSQAGVAYLGALLEQDPQYIWLAGRALDNLDQSNGSIFAQPGVEHAIDMAGRSPQEGSCLMYGDSGLPNQAGPLAPDKIVFRDGWSSDSMYALLNLRFTGWHRYKATNTLTLVYKGAPLIVDEQQGSAFDWLPTGRSLFRDKRIPRENLNGLVIENTGMSAVLYTLTGVGSPWAQDPPYYVSVERFETDGDKDISTTVLDDWQGWRHARTIYFYHHGPIIVFDDASGKAGDQAAMIWH